MINDAFQLETLLFLSLRTPLHRGFALVALPPESARAVDAGLGAARQFFDLPRSEKSRLATDGASGEGYAAHKARRMRCKLNTSARPRMHVESAFVFQLIEST